MEARRRLSTITHTPPNIVVERYRPPCKPAEVRMCGVKSLGSGLARRPATPPWPTERGAPGSGPTLSQGASPGRNTLLAACGVMDALPHQALAGAGGVGLWSHPGTRHRRLQVCEDRSPPRRRVWQPRGRAPGTTGVERGAEKA